MINVNQALNSTRISTHQIVPLKYELKLNREYRHKNHPSIFTLRLIIDQNIALLLAPQNHSPIQPMPHMNVARTD